MGCLDSLCEDPGDISMKIIDLVTMCACEPLKFPLKFCRTLLGIAFGFAEAAIVYTQVLKEYVEDAYELEWILGFAAVYVVCLIIVVGFGMKAAKTDDKKPHRRFVIAFKSVNLLLAIVNAVGLIYAREDLDFNEPWQVVVVILVGMDIVVDPIELILLCCCLRNE